MMEATNILSIILENAINFTVLEVTGETSSQVLEQKMFRSHDANENHQLASLASFHDLK